MRLGRLVPPVLASVVACLGAQEAPARAQALVKEAVAYGRKYGMDALLREVNQGNGRFHVKSGDEVYIFIYDLQGTCLAIGFQSQMVGTNRLGVRDPSGKLFLQEMLQVARTRGSGWVDYQYPHPKHGRIEEKTSYVELFEGALIGGGVYK